MALANEEICGKRGQPAPRHERGRDTHGHAACGDKGSASVGRPETTKGGHMRRSAFPRRPGEQWLTPSVLLWLTMAFMTVWIIGAHVDAWYHIHEGFAIETFFTWTHALLYAGVAATGLVAAFALAASLRRGVDRRAELPTGFVAVLLGAVLFGAGGLVDLLWHEAFGFEADLEALLSPAHLWLVAASMLAIAGLVRAGIAYRAFSGGRVGRLRVRDVPLVLSLALLFRSVLWNLTFSEPLVVDYPATEPVAPNVHAFEHLDRASLGAQIAGVTGILVHGILLSLFIVVALRRLALPGGSVAVIVLVNALFEVAINDAWRYLPAAVGAAAAGEWIWAGIRAGRLGGINSTGGYWVLGFTTPFVLIAGYVVLVLLGGGILWSTHLWLGAPVMAGFYGLIASLLVAPPRWLGVPPAESGERTA
jgi:hypothetical protein